MVLFISVAVRPMFNSGLRSSMAKRTKSIMLR